MKTSESLAALSTFVDPTHLSKKLAQIQEITLEATEEIIPSIQMGPGGNVLASVILLSKSYMTELRTPSDLDGLDFDVCRRLSINNYRVKTWKHLVKEGEETKSVVKLASVELLQGLTALGTRITYAGEDDESWLRDIVKLIPMALLMEE